MPLEVDDQVLLVEGETDLHVVKHLAMAHELPENFAVVPCGNDRQALRQLNAQIVAPDGPRTLGIVLDANGEPAAHRWRSIRDKLHRYRYELPEAPVTSGGIFERHRPEPRLGIWIMPDNEGSGMLEDFCLRFLEDDVREAVEEAVQLGEHREMTSFKEPHRSKALIHTYLAWQDEPGHPLGLAFKGNTLDAFHPAAESFVRWLRELFGESPWAELDRLGAELERSSTSSKMSGEILDEIRRRDWD